MGKVDKEILHDFAPLKDKVLAVVVFGGYLTGNYRDIDVCIVAPKYKGKIGELYKIIWRKINADKYDVSAFEDLPLHMKWSVIGNYKTYYCNDEDKLFDYFRYYSKLKEDSKFKEALA
jgi:predicted nucleotidyltransferase